MKPDISTADALRASLNTAFLVGGGEMGALICANSDDTSRVIGERQLMLLRELAASTDGVHDGAHEDGYEAAAGHPAAEDDDSAAGTAARLRILYVEDDELVRISTAELLRTFGLTIHEAEDEAQALRLLGEEPVDVLLTDVGLAGRSGVELAIEACRYRPHLPVIFLSGYDLVLTPAQQAALPEATSLRKPYDPMALVNLLMRHAR